MKYRFIKPVLLLLLISTVMLACSSLSRQPAGWKEVDAILKQIVPPDFPAQTFDIRDFGAVEGGDTDCSLAIQKAVEACHKAGGGRVLIPQGRYLSGPIHLKSHVNLHLAEGAVLAFSRNVQDYLPPVRTRFEGMECMNYSPFIYALNAANVAVTGQGTLDGQADETNWWYWTGKAKDGWLEGMPHQGRARNALMEMIETDVPVEQRVFGKGHYLRPNFIQFNSCRNVLVEDVTILRSPMWEIHPVLCENVTVRRVHIDSHGPNNDGCNPESSRNVHIKDCYFDVGDDCIAIKSGRNGDGRRIGRPSENIVIQSCTMKDGHGGVVIGSEISGSCRNVFAEDCLMDSPNLDRALRIKTNSIRGGVVENVYFRNVTVREVSDAVVRIYFNYEEGDAGAFTPVVRNIHLDNVVSEKSRYALLLDGYQRSPISDIYLESCRFDGVAEGNFLTHVKNLVLKDVFINGELQPKRIDR